MPSQVAKAKGEFFAEVRSAQVTYFTALVAKGVNVVGPDVCAESSELPLSALSERRHARRNTPHRNLTRSVTAARRLSGSPFLVVAPPDP